MGEFGEETLQGRTQRRIVRLASGAARHHDNVESWQHGPPITEDFTDQAFEAAAVDRSAHLFLRDGQSEPGGT